MNRDDIIRMAREAGWTGPEENVTYVAMLERFAKLVAEAERNDGIKLKNIEHPISLGDASDYKFSSESIEEGWLQREWIGLTDEDRREIIDETEPEDKGYVMALVEAKLKEKNNAN